MALAVTSAASCGPRVGTEDPIEKEQPPECPAEEPYPLECQSAYRELCESKMTEQDCAATPSLWGGVSLYCWWVTPVSVVQEAGECVASDAPARCVALATPGDIACGPHHAPQVEGSGALLLTGECYPVGWEECGTADGPPECACLL